MSYPDWLLSHPRTPPNDEKGDDNLSAIFTEVGRVTNAWECLECSLQMIFMFALRARDIGPMKVYGIVLSSSSRIEMTHEAIKSYAFVNRKPEIFEDFKEIRSMVKHLSALRNLVAHGMTARLDSFGNQFTNSSEDERGGEFFLIPAMYNAKNMDGLPKIKRWYNSKTIRSIARAITDTDISAQTFLSKHFMGGKHSPPFTTSVNKDMKPDKTDPP